MTGESHSNEDGVKNHTITGGVSHAKVKEENHANMRE
jgi:hypothetical protein